MLRRSAPTRREAPEVVRWAALRVYAPCRDPGQPVDGRGAMHGPATPATSRDGPSERRAQPRVNPLGAPGCGPGGRRFEFGRGVIGSRPRQSGRTNEAWQAQALLLIAQRRSARHRRAARPRRLEKRLLGVGSTTDSKPEAAAIRGALVFLGRAILCGASREDWSASGSPCHPPPHPRAPPLPSGPQPRPSGQAPVRREARARTGLQLSAVDGSTRR